MVGLSRRLSAPLKKLIREYVPDFGAITLGAPMEFQPKGRTNEEIGMFFQEQRAIRRITLSDDQMTDKQRRDLTAFISHWKNRVISVETTTTNLPEGGRKKVQQYLEEKQKEIRTFLRIIYALLALFLIAAPLLLYYLGGCELRVLLSTFGALTVFAAGCLSLHRLLTNDLRSLELGELMLDSFEDCDVLDLLDKLF